MSQVIIIESWMNNDLIKSIRMVAYGPFTDDMKAQQFMDNGKRHYPLHNWDYVNLYDPEHLTKSLVGFDHCMCYPYCKNDAQKTPNSPYMDEYCDNCTYERHDISTHPR